MRLPTPNGEPVPLGALVREERAEGIGNFRHYNFRRAIAVNAAIVLNAAANGRLARGMSLLHATLYAARRRVTPILITALTTVAGLLSLATGLGGKSLVWGPVATAIVWGLTFSTVLTLLVVPLLYRTFMGRGQRRG